MVAAAAVDIGDGGGVLCDAAAAGRIWPLFATRPNYCTQLAKMRVS